MENLEQEIREGIFQARLRKITLNQVVIIEKLQDKALEDDTTPNIHLDIAAAADALANLMETSGEVMVLVEEDGEGVG